MGPSLGPLTALLTLTLAASESGCGGNTTSRCGPGTTLSRDGVCVATEPGEPPSNVTCGPGTIADGPWCVVVPGSGGAPSTGPDGGSSAGAPPTAKDVTPPTFGGATRAVPVSDQAVLVSWDQADDSMTQRSRIVYEVAWGDASGFAPDWTRATRSEPGALNVVVRDLPKARTRYYFVARAVDEAGNADDNGRIREGSHDN